MPTRRLPTAASKEANVRPALLLLSLTPVAFAATVAASALHWHDAACALIAAALMASSRMCMGLHFPSDIVAELAVGTIRAWGVGFLPGHLRAARRTPTVAPSAIHTPGLQVLERRQTLSNAG